MKSFLLNEIKYFLRQIYHRYPRQRMDLIRYRCFAPILSLELKPYTFENCLLAAWSCKPIPYDWMGTLAACFYIRSGRGKATLEEAREKFTCTYGETKGGKS